MLLRIIYSLFLYSLSVISVVIATSIALLFVPFTKPKTRPFQIAAHIWARFLISFSRIKMSASRIKNIPNDKPVLLVSNHQGMADIPLLLAYLPVHFRFVIKKELFKIPIFGWYLKKAGYLSIDRTSVLRGYRTLEKVAEVIKTGESILIFPEGTRTKTGKLGKFKKGSLLPALKSGAPIIPIAISGVFNIIPPGTWLINPGPVKLHIGKPIYIRSEAEYKKKLDEVRETIAKMMQSGEGQ